jgi:hypothetical protein
MAELYFTNESQPQATLDSQEGIAAVVDLSNYAMGGVTLLTRVVES